MKDMEDGIIYFANLKVHIVFGTEAFVGVQTLQRKNKKTNGHSCPRYPFKTVQLELCRKIFLNYTAIK